MFLLSPLDILLPDPTDRESGEGGQSAVPPPRRAGEGADMSEVGGLFQGVNRRLGVLE